MADGATRGRIEARSATGHTPGATGQPEGATGYPLDQLYEEVAFVAYHFNWDHETVLTMPHWERQRWCEEISRINERMTEERE